MTNPLFDSFWRDERAYLWDAIEPLTMRALLAGAEGAAALLPGEIAPLVNWDFFNRAALRYLGEYRLTTVTGINATTQQQAIEAINEWVRSGQGIQSLKTKLGPIFGQTRADSIASTEVTRIVAEGNMQLWGSTGVVAGKRWMTAVTDVCPVCAPLHMRIVQIDSNFGFTNDELGNEILQKATKHLGTEFRAPPAHPRCILPGNEVVVPGAIEAATKSFYRGPAVEVVLSDGRKLTVTENHPILTRHGWVAAGELHEGMDILGSADSQGIASLINPDNDNVPVPIEQLWDSLKMSLAMSSISVPGSAEYFHGDGRFVDGNIEIVYPDGLLLGDGVAHRNQHIREGFLVRGNMQPLLFDSLGAHDHFFAGGGASSGSIMGGGNLGGALGVGHLRPLEFFGLGLTANVNASARKPAPDCPAINSEGIGKGVFRFAGDVPFNDFSVRQVNPRSSREGLGLSGFVESLSNKHLSQSLVMDTKLAGKFLERFAGLVAPVEVAKVRMFEFSDHVYDLQVSPYHLYFTGGIITHNCRCWLQPVVSEELLRDEIGDILAQQFFAKVRDGKVDAFISSTRTRAARRNQGR